MSTPVGEIPRTTAHLTRADHFGTCKARLGVGRMHYGVESGLYGIGTPTDESPVLVTSNYKLTFDHLRRTLDGRDAWILVVDTHGINVWCAAGEGNFSTERIVSQIEASQLGEVVSHRTLVLPQLGAPGVAAHAIKSQTGFRVVYGPVRAEDIAPFLDADMNATPEMRRVRFPMRDRVVLIPVEVLLGAKSLGLVALGFLLLGGLGTDGNVLSRILTTGVASAGLFLIAAIAAIILTPVLLPWLPGRAFALKGLWIGLATAAAMGTCWCAFPGMAVLGGTLSLVAWCLMIPVVTSFLAMNFTGATTYTSLSGVRREMGWAVPIQAIAGLLGVALWIVGRFV